MVASKREEMDREIDHVLISQSENLRRYWEVSSPLQTWSWLSLLDQDCACICKGDGFCSWSARAAVTSLETEVEFATKHTPEGCSRTGYM